MKKQYSPTITDFGTMNVCALDREIISSPRAKSCGPIYSASRSVAEPLAVSVREPLVSFLQTRGISLVMDIGAGTGEFATRLRLSGYDHRIISVEPIRGYYSRLRKHALADPAWETVQCALGDKDGIVEMAMPMESIPSGARTGTAATVTTHDGDLHTEDVVMSRISTLIPAFRIEQEQILIHLNVPGRERDILRGSRAVIDDISAFHIHVSLQHDSDGVSTIDEMTRTMKAMQFECVAITPGTIDAATGTMRSAGMTFARPLQA